MNIQITVDGAENINKVLNGLQAVRLDAIKAKQVTQISNRAAAALGTPGATPRKTGELRISAHADFSDFTFGYAKEYAPHVEYGHRTRNGGLVAGQFYLRTNKETQAPIFEQDVKNEIERILG